MAKGKKKTTNKVVKEKEGKRTCLPNRQGRKTLVLRQRSQKQRRFRQRKFPL